MEFKQDLYLLEKFEVGVIHLDARRNVVGLNDFARKVLPVDEKKPFNKLVTSFHPPRSQPKVKFLLDEAASCPMGTASPMTMIINIPEQVLLIKVTRISDLYDVLTGFVLVFYDVTQIVSPDKSVQAALTSTDPSSMMLASEPQSPASGDNIQLSRIPVVSDKKVSFIEAGDVLCLESQAHYTRLLTQQGYKFCNLSIGDLESRLNKQQFLRVHRRFIVNVKAVSELERIGSKTQVVIGNKSRTIVPVSRDELGKLKFLLGLHR